MEQQSDQKRSGETTVTSISLSKEFKKLCDDYNISPSSAVRKGIAIELFERGVSKYVTELNTKRFSGIQELLKSWEDIEKASDHKIYTKILECQREIDRILEIFGK